MSEVITTTTVSPVEISMLDEQLPATAPSKQVPPEFDLNAVHNGEACIASLNPKDERENKFWFTIAMFVTIFNESDKTIRNNIEELAQEGELGDCKIFQRRISIEDSCGVPHPTTIYNLNVLNRLGMCCFRKNKKAKGVRDKFNDVLLDRETGVTQTQTTLAIPKTLPEALRAYADEVERREAAEKRAITAESERDEAVRTKAMIGSRREATAMATASAKSKECEKLREQIGDAKTYKAVTAITWLPDYFDMSNRGLYGSLAANLKKVEAGMSPEFAHTDIPDSRYGTVKAYHVDVIERLHEMVQADETLMEKYRKIASV